MEKRKRAITARRQHLKSVMLQIAATELEKESAAKEQEKADYLAEHCPPLHLPGSMQELQLEDLNQKLFDLRGKFKRPPLRRVRMSADAMLRALLGSKHKEKDLRDVGDWRKNIEEKSGMEGRKKMFEGGGGE
ncbi:hypothetical protein JD844_021917 [Phrynosoma platyrhinos]|uniref:Troponin I, fast skeletal muscle n=1 Tax=Phrynosoma platyrhinos TaxID=52577 RepID=A0ABQ7SUJ5_PHRPL|nr:hypothetical protein JD844_021917 [Phrynosoma platyrhinos]